MVLADAGDDLGIGVGGRVGLLLPREREHDSGVAVAVVGDRIVAVLTGDLDARPLAPQVEAGRRLDGVDDERAPDTRGRLEEEHVRIRRPAFTRGGFDSGTIEGWLPAFALCASAGHQERLSAPDELGVRDATLQSEPALQPAVRVE